MKLKSLRLQNYRVHQDSTLSIGDATFVILRGPNGGGKTSFADAFSMNVTDTAVSLPLDGKGFQDKITQGEAKSIITAEIEGQHLLRNTVTLNTNTSGRVGKVECLDEPENKKIINGFENFLADKKSALLIACNTDYFLKLDKQKQTDLLAKLVLPSHYDFPEDKMDAVDDVLGEGKVDFDAEPFTVITGAYKLLHKERETVNRQVKEFVIPDALPISKGVDSESLQTQLIEIKAKRSNLQLERDTAVATANNVEVKRATLKTKIEGLRGEVEKGKKKLAELDTSILSAEQVKAFTEVIAKADELAKLKSNHSVLHGSIVAVSAQISRLKGISDQGATCPVCDQTIDVAQIESLVRDLEKELAEADKRIQALDTHIEAIGDVQAAKESLKKHESATKEKAELEASLLEIVKNGKAARIEFDALPEAVDAKLPFNDPLADLQAKEDKINEQLRPVIAAEERASEIKRLTAQKDKLVAKAAKLQELVVYFDKDGVKKTLIADHVGSFENKVNMVMDAFGCKTSLAFDPISFNVTTKRRYTGPIKEICGAEGEIFKRAFQCAVSIAAGIKLVVIDEMEELGSDIRGAMFQSVYSLIDDGLLDQAIFIEFSLDKVAPDPKKRVPNSKYLYVTDGTVEELK